MGKGKLNNTNINDFRLPFLAISRNSPEKAQRVVADYRAGVSGAGVSAFLREQKFQKLS